MHDVNAFLDTLSSHLEGLKESGVAKVPWEGPMPQAKKQATPPAPSPRQQVAAPKIVPAEKPKPVLPPSPPPTPDPKLVQPKVTFKTLLLRRHPDCEDAIPASQTRILLIVEASELEEPHHTLLSEMLKAIGYSLAAASEIQWDGQRPLAKEADRILVMGNEALQATSTAGMDLQIVRGMWQQSPHGKLISTFPPSYLQDNNPGKKAAWGDLQKILKDLSLSLPSWTREKLKKR